MQTRSPLKRLTAAGSIAVALALAPGAARAQAPGTVYEAVDRGWLDAIMALKAQDIVTALARADGTGLRVAGKLIRYLDYTGGDGAPDPVEMARFVEANPDWPSLDRIRVRIEELAGLAPDPFVADWLTRHPPTTTSGRIAFADALQRLGDTARLPAAVRDAWAEANLTEADEQSFLARHGVHLGAADHARRADRALWTGNTGAARRLIPLLAEPDRRIVELRVLLRDGTAPPDPAEAARLAAGSPGLRLDLARHYRRLEDDIAAQRLLAEAGDPVEPERWWVERNILARRAVRNGAPADAYRLAAGHRLPDSAAFVDAEFLAGWVALRRLGDPARADRHFARIAADATLPITVSRAAYWRGRAAEASGDTAGAGRHYAVAAGHPETFYGQLAVERLGQRGVPPWLTAQPAVTAATQARFEALELTQAARLLTAVGEAAKARPFLLRLGELARTPEEHRLAADLAADLALPGVSSWVARRAAYRGVHLVERAYPLVAVTPGTGVEPGLVHAVIRQESLFNPRAVSPAGARGLMQLMPATARQVAREIAKPYELGRLLSDPDYNISLGSRYLNRMLAEFEGSYVLSVAAYNAGPNRVKQWLRDHGSPRDAGTDAIDWIEQIPFTETRNYVQRVMENLQVYRWRLEGTGRPLALRADLAR